MGTNRYTEGISRGGNSVFEYTHGTRFPSFQYSPIWALKSSPLFSSIPSMKKISEHDFSSLSFYFPPVPFSGAQSVTNSNSFSPNPNESESASRIPLPLSATMESSTSFSPNPNQSESSSRIPPSETVKVWIAEVKSGEKKFLVRIDKGSSVQIQLISLGEIDEDLGDIFVNVTVKNKKLVLAVLDPMKLPAKHVNVTFLDDFHISHNLQYGSVFLVGAEVHTPTKRIQNHGLKKRSGADALRRALYASVKNRLKSVAPCSIFRRTP